MEPRDSLVTITRKISGSPDPKRALLSELARDPEIFRVIVTSESRGSIPSSIWNQSWVIFLEDLAP